MHGLSDLAWLGDVVWSTHSGHFSLCVCVCVASECVPALLSPGGASNQTNELCCEVLGIFVVLSADGGGEIVKAPQK